MQCGNVGCANGGWVPQVEGASESRGANSFGTTGLVSPYRYDSKLLAESPPAISEAFYAVVPDRIVRSLRGSSSRDIADLMKGAEQAVVTPPHAVARVHLEGTLPTDPWYRESWDSSRDWIKMMQLGMAYRITGKRSYLEAEQRYLAAWLDTYKISFNPIDETPMDQMLIAYDLTRADLPASLQIRMMAFERAMAEGYITRIEDETKEDVYNWQSHRIKLAMLCAYAVGDQALVSKAVAIFRHHLNGNLLHGNVVIDFPHRDALHYRVYDLEPLAMAALAAKEHGMDLFDMKNKTGASVRGAIDWLEPYATGTKTHLEFVHSPVKFDLARAAAEVKGFSGPWDPSQSLLLYATASNLSNRYVRIYRAIQGRSGCHTHDWLLALQRAGL